MVYQSYVIQWAQPLQRHEQIWVGILMIALAIFCLTEAVSLLLFVNPYVGVLLKAIWTITFNTATVFYLWTNLHAFRLGMGGLPSAFYVPKLLFLFVLSFLCSFHHNRVRISSIPLLSLLLMLRFFHHDELYPHGDVVLSVVSISLVQIFVIAWIFREWFVTSRVLHLNPDSRMRRKRQELKLFTENNLLFYFFFLCSKALPALLLSNHHLRYSLGVFDYSNEWENPGISVLFVTYVLTEAYQRLPRRR